MSDQGPVAQEAQRGHRLLDVGNGTFAEVSRYKGKVYASIRRWFRADDGRWYRTKNGLNMKIEEMYEYLDHTRALHDFLDEEAENPWEDQQ